MAASGQCPRPCQREGRVRRSEPGATSKGAQRDTRLGHSRASRHEGTAVSSLGDERERARPGRRGRPSCRAPGQPAPGGSCCLPGQEPSRSPQCGPGLAGQLQRGLPCPHAAVPGRGGEPRPGFRPKPPFPQKSEFHKLADAKVFLSDCLACDSCVTAEEGARLAQQNAEDFSRVLSLNQTPRLASGTGLSRPVLSPHGGAGALTAASPPGTRRLAAQGAGSVRVPPGPAVLRCQVQPQRGRRVPETLWLPQEPG
ncbi:PREDICTED: nuclear prelamin A recognition factor [Condylura cristata]|uniref:nuclear prelamin A recognition factor n=1 Tax=Condylura cristata TaxID=143302 RepID=UPI000643C495|nr:PREDICTED: nuclear prelamin A recognition factor [Condylura cristata]